MNLTAVLQHTKHVSQVRMGMLDLQILVSRLLQQQQVAVVSLS